MLTLAAPSLCGDGGIHGDVSASDDEHVSGQAGLFVAPVGAQELKAPVDAGELDALPCVPCG